MPIYGEVLSTNLESFDIFVRNNFVHTAPHLVLIRLWVGHRHRRGATAARGLRF